MAKKVLVVEDDSNIAELLRRVRVRIKGEIETDGNQRYPAEDGTAGTDG